MSDRAHRRYSEVLKRRIVADVEAGPIAQDEPTEGCDMKLQHSPKYGRVCSDIP